LRITFSVNTGTIKNFRQVYYVCKIPSDGGYTQAKHQETEIKNNKIHNKKSHHCQLKTHDGERDTTTVKKRTAQAKEKALEKSTPLPAQPVSTRNAFMPVKTVHLEDAEPC
jgi:DNA polymerase sigma